MDCKTAQLLLEFARPRANELPADDAHALEDHLTQCPDCTALAQSERRLDEHLGRAMRAVEVPDQLRAHLMNRLDAERSDCYKRWAGHGLRVAAAAAACLLIVAGGVYGWSQYRYWNRPELDPGEVWKAVFGKTVSPPDRAEVEKSFKDVGVQTVLPELNYRYLTAHGIATFQGVSVPQLVFNHDEDQGHNHAVVYVISDRQFKLQNLPANYQSPGGYQYKVSILHREGSAYAFVIVHTGETYDWLKPAQ
jgi:hypothetical protein